MAIPKSFLCFREMFLFFVIFPLQVGFEASNFTLVLTQTTPTF